MTIVLLLWFCLNRESSCCLFLTHRYPFGKTRLARKILEGIDYTLLAFIPATTVSSNPENWKILIVSAMPTAIPVNTEAYHFHCNDFNKRIVDRFHISLGILSEFKGVN